MFPIRTQVRRNTSPDIVRVRVRGGRGGEERRSRLGEHRGLKSVLVGRGARSSSSSAGRGERGRYSKKRKNQKRGEEQSTSTVGSTVLVHIDSYHHWIQLRRRRNRHQSAPASPSSPEKHGDVVRKHVRHRRIRRPQRER